MILIEERLSTPIGELVVMYDNDAVLRVVDFADCATRTRRLLDRNYGAGSWYLRGASCVTETARRLAAYFAGDLDAIDKVPTATGGTEFQRAVWAALRAVRAGETACYGEIAARIGHRAAVRAVGLANGANPIAIVVPCHRIIGRSGALTGYGGGIVRKQWLLAHEVAHSK